MSTGKATKALISICSFILFFIVGCIARLLMGPIELIPVSSFILNLVLIGAPAGVIAAILGYMFPKPMSYILCFIPGVEIS